jgi:hypothetical protein
MCLMLLLLVFTPCRLVFTKTRKNIVVLTVSETSDLAEIRLLAKLNYVCNNTILCSH